MDGPIGEAMNKRALNSGVSDIAVSDGDVPEKRAKLESSSSMKVEICNQLTSKLTISPPPIASPDKNRTVSSTDSSLPGASHSFDFRFVAGDDEVRQLLVARADDAHRDVTLISHPDDLSQANLVTRLSIAGDGRHSLRSGKLFEGTQPLTLVMDIRKLTSEELPKFNDLLDPDSPCLYDKVSQKKRPLGEHVALLVVANPEQLELVGQSVKAPGADFWRRINRPENTWQFDAQTDDGGAMDISKVPPVLAELPSAESAMDDDNTVLIDCHMHTNWRHLLLGGPGVDKQGRIQHIPGRLESLRAGQRVILKGADWQDLAFEQAIRQILAQKSFESNGKLCLLPDDVQFYQMPLGKDELHSLFHSLSHSCVKELPLAPPIIINQSNISGWLNPIAVAPEGYAVPNINLLEQVRAGGVVTVTSPLTEAHWFCLLGSLQTIRETTDLQPRLQVAHTKRQPKTLGLGENDEHSIKALTAFDSITYQQDAQASHWINHQQAPLVIQVNEQTGLSQLFDNIHITSQQKAHFGRRQTELQEALTSGKPVVLRGLDSNPALQQLLEPLVIGQPLLVNGQLQAYPQAQVTVVWPESAESPSSVFRSMVAKGKPCPEVDIWAINGDKHDIPRAELPERALHSLYEAFKTLPDDLCDPLPEMTEGLLNNLMLAARRAQQVDQSPQLLPCHWRKAINSVVTHGTRQNPSVRDFMKVACWQLLPDANEKPDAHEKPDRGQTGSVDPDRLNSIINSSAPLDRKFLRQNLWSLARAFDPAVFKDSRFEGLQLSYKTPFTSWLAQGEYLDRLSAMIVAHAPEDQREAMAYQLAVDPSKAEPYQALVIRPARQIKRLQDALASGWQLPLPSGQTRSDAIHTLASDCFQMARTANSETEGIERIEHRLSESLEWQGSTDKPLSLLARDLYHGELNQKDRESRRLSRLNDRLTDSPVIFLQGETGTGKSYFSARMAKASGQASVISLGPSDSEQTLLKCWQWQEHADGDRSMKQQNRTLMEWAKTTHDKDGEYVTLILDEANLARAGLLASLNGLWEPEPCIYVNGHPVKVSPKHRIILTGNPDYYAGRQLDPALKEKLPRAYYPRLDLAFLRDRVVEPSLHKQLQRHLPGPQIDDIALSVTESVMTLWEYYQELLPEHQFTPRDLTDICSWVGWYLDRALPPGGSVSGKQMHGLVRQSFRDVLGPEISEMHQDALTALEIWFAARYEPDNTLSDRVHNLTTLQPIQQAFKEFTEQTRPDFDTSGSAVRELVQQLGQDLSRCQQAYHLNRQHDGRQATLIIGPAGRGKDATLNLVIESVKRQIRRRGEFMPEVFPLNACDCSWEKVCEKIQRAKVHGGIVVISEMNLIDSQHLEGELNDILAGDAHPGFHLFATINPPEYSGRKPLSPALKGRFRHLPIRQYSPTELQTIAEKVLPETRQGKIIAEQLTKLHCRLRAYLQRKKLPLQPTSLDLQNVARAVVRGGDFTEKALHQCLNQYYRLYLVAAKTSLEKLPGSSALAIGKSGLDIELCKWFNQTFSRINRPWVIRRSYLNSIDEKSHEIRIKDKLSDTEIRTEIVKRMAEAKWRANGLPLRPGRSEDIIIQALYQHWLTRWFDLEYGHAGANADSLFQMTEEVKRTLQMLASRGYLQEADQRIEAWHADDARLWPAFWHQMSDMANRWVDDFTEEALADEKTAIASDHDPKQYISEVEWEKAPALDCSTNFEDQVEQHYVQCEVFNTRNYPLNMYRWWAMDVNVTAQGDIRQLVINDKHIHGFDTLKPERLPEHGREVALASNQTLATFEIPSNIDKYALPSLKANDYIVALRVEPDLPFTLIRDRYTGLHTLYFTEASTKQGIECAYVIEHRESGKKTPAKRARPNRSIRSDACCSEGMKTVLNKLFENANEQPPEVQVILSRIENAKNTEQKVEAITDYCRSFSGNFKPERPKNFFEFLVTKRQGSCRHRAPVFVAFCRYFGIPSRQIGSRIHRFAEYSGDGGKTWKSVDLGGATSRLTKIIPHFQPTIRFGRYSSEFNKIKTLLKDILKSADLAQQQALAKACGVSLEELNRILESALPAANLDIHKVARKLWEEKDLTGFSLGVSILESLETDLLGDREKELVSVVSRYPGHICKSMSDAVIRILSDSDKDLVTEQLNLLHSKMIDQAGVSPYQWLTSMVYTLAKCDRANPSFILFAREALESGWLDPLPTYDSEVMRADFHHWLLERLEDVDELKVQATHCLKKWYGELLSREKNSQVWQLAYERFQKSRGANLLVTHCHDGFSRLLEKKIASSLIQPVWTDQPEGVPDIERMLVHNPAFPQLISGKGNHRPVIIMGEPSRHETGMAEKTEALFRLNVENSPELKRILEKDDQCKATKQQYYSDIQALEKDHRETLGYQKNHAQKEYEKKNLAIKSWYKPIIESLEASPEDRKLLDDLRKKCSRAIWQAFSHYLYGVANSKGGCLTYCWAKASFGASVDCENYGAHAPSSPEELYAMMSVIDNSRWFVQAIKDNYLRQANDASDALILRSDELTKIAEEFFNNVNLQSISNALV